MVLSQQFCLRCYLSSSACAVTSAIPLAALPPDVRQGFALPSALKLKLGYAPRSAFGRRASPDRGRSPTPSRSRTARQSLASHQAAQPRSETCYNAKAAVRDLLQRKSRGPRPATTQKPRFLLVLERYQRTLQVTHNATPRAARLCSRATPETDMPTTPQPIATTPQRQTHARRTSRLHTTSIASRDQRSTRRPTR
jgi:hypothetical protein